MMAAFLFKCGLMELNIQISYKNQRAQYTVTSFNFVSYTAELTDFTGFEGDKPPSYIHFIKTKDRVIASSDIVDIAKSLAKQLRSQKSTPLQEAY